MNLQGSPGARLIVAVTLFLQALPVLAAEPTLDSYRRGLELVEQSLSAIGGEAALAAGIDRTPTRAEESSALRSTRDDIGVPPSSFSVAQQSRLRTSRPVALRPRLATGLPLSKLSGVSQ